MLKNAKGLTLIEVTASLAILTVIIAGTVPLLITVQHERQTIKQQLYAYEVLQNMIEEYRATSIPPFNESSIITKDNTTYRLTAHTISNSILQFCINWEGKNGRQYEECGMGSHG